MASSDTDRPEVLPRVRPRVLIVEDSRTMRETLRLLLAPEFDCQVAEDGVSALELAQAEPPDLILSDVEMRGVDGYALVHGARALAALAHVRIVLLSGHAPRSQGHGADLYLVKPVRPALLIAHLHALLRRP